MSPLCKKSAARGESSFVNSELRSKRAPNVAPTHGFGSDEASRYAPAMSKFVVIGIGLVDAVDWVCVVSYDAPVVSERSFGVGSTSASKRTSPPYQDASASVENAPS